MPTLARAGSSEFGAAEPYAAIPFVVEAWAEADAVDTSLTVCVNRTPITGEIEAARDKRDIDAFGCGLAHTIAQAPKEARVRHLAQHHDAVHADHVATARHLT